MWPVAQKMSLTELRSYKSTAPIARSASPASPSPAKRKPRSLGASPLPTRLLPRMPALKKTQILHSVNLG